MNTRRKSVVSGVCNAAHLHAPVLVGDHPGCADMLQRFGCREPWASGEIPVLCGRKSCHIVEYSSIEKPLLGNATDPTAVESIAETPSYTRDQYASRTGSETRFAKFSP